MLTETHASRAAVHSSVRSEYVLISAFRGAGKTTVDMAFNHLWLWVFRLPAAYALLHWTPATIAGIAIPTLDAAGVWYGIAVSNVVTLIFAFLWFKRGTWKQRVVNDVAGPSLGIGD